MIEAKSIQGNIYAWDAETGLYIPFPPSMEAIARELFSTDILSKRDIIERLGSNFREEDIVFCFDWIQKWKKIRPKKSDILEDLSHRNVTTSDIENYVLRYGLRQLTLGVTEDCNFRCKYCAYSDQYKYTRNPSKRYMDFAVAKKAIDHYFSLLETGRRYNPKREPSVSFYGGEPLLNFDLIKNCVEYIKDTYGAAFKIHFNMTTNGSLLHEDKADWLAKNKFAIFVSLDGPEEEHNRNRVYINGRGTFKDVMKNTAKLIRDKYENLAAICVYDLKSDLFKLENFFSKEENPSLSRSSMVNPSQGCKYYDQFSKEDYLAYTEVLKKALAHYLENGQQGNKASFFDKLFCANSIQVINLIYPVFSPRPNIMPLTGACIPGSKIFVDVFGNFHICERVLEIMPIGNVDVGLDFEKINKLISDYLCHMDKCVSCELKNSCPQCYSQFMTAKGFSYSSEVCIGMEHSRAKQLDLAFSLCEIDPTFIDTGVFKQSQPSTGGNSLSQTESDYVLKNVDCRLDGCEKNVL